MAEFDITDVLRKTFLAGVGAVASTAEKSAEVIAELVKKGELTVEQGKKLNSELTRKAKEVADDTSDAVLRAHLSRMTPEQRAEWADKVAKMAAEIDESGDADSDADAVKVEVEISFGDDEDDEDVAGESDDDVAHEEPVNEAFEDAAE